MKAQSIFLLLAVCSIGFYSASGQDEGKKLKSSFSDKKTEINIGIANIFSKPVWDSWYYENFDQISDLNLNSQPTKITVGMKFHNSKGAYRISTGIHYSLQNNENPDIDDDENRTKLLTTDLNVGYEWHSPYNRVTIFYGFDLLTGYQYYNYHYENATDLSESKTNIYKYGLAPVLGAYYFVTPNLSLGTEIKFNAVGYSEKSESNWQYGLGPDMNSGTSRSTTSGVQTWFGPMGYLSVNIHF